MSSSPPTAQVAARAGMWSGIDLLLRQGLQFAVTVVLARLLTPLEFGTIALLAVFTSLCAMILEGGANTALIRTAGSSRLQESSVFWFNLLAGIACAGAMLLLAPLVARFYEIPVLVPLMALAALQVVTLSLGSIHTALLTRALRFRSLLLVGVTATTLSGGLAILLAAWGFGVWALAAQTLTSAAVTTAMLWAVSRWRPVWRVSFTEARALLRFGSHVVVSGMLDIFYTQGFALLIGKMYGVADVGIYARAQNTQNLPAGVISGIIGRISLPILASRIGDMEQLQRAAARSIRLAMAMVMPTMVGLAAMADVAVALLYGPAWAAAAPILAVLALASAFYPHGLIVQYGILAQDKSRAYLNLVALKIGLGLLSVVVGSFFGIMGLAYSQLAYSFGAIWLNAHAARRHLSYGYWQQFRDMAGLCVAAAGMGIGIVLLRSMTALHPAWEALIFIPAGAAIYLTLGLALRLEPVREALHIAASSLPKRRTAGPGSVQDRGKP